MTAFWTYLNSKNMNTLQPNFETFKKCVYQYCFPNNSVTTVNATLSLALLGADFRPMSHKIEDLKAQVSTFLDRLDIRQVPYMVANVKEVQYPIWIRKGNYKIDYNSNGMLDLIKN